MANGIIYIFQISTDLTDGRWNKLYWISDIGSCNSNNAEIYQKCPEGNKINWAFFRGTGSGDRVDDWKWDWKFRIECGLKNMFIDKLCILLSCNIAYENIFHKYPVFP